jgi:hypothetical protein
VACEQCAPVMRITETIFSISGIILTHSSVERIRRFSVDDTKAAHLQSSIHPSSMHLSLTVILSYPSRPSKWTLSKMFTQPKRSLSSSI